MWEYVKAEVSFWKVSLPYHTLIPIPLLSPPTWPGNEPMTVPKILRVWFPLQIQIFWCNLCVWFVSAIVWLHFLLGPGPPPTAGDTAAQPPHGSAVLPPDLLRGGRILLRETHSFSAHPKSTCTEGVHVCVCMFVCMCVFVCLCVCMFTCVSFVCVLPCKHVVCVLPRKHYVGCTWE